LTQAVMLGRAVVGGRPGRGPLRVGADPDAPWVDRKVFLHAHEAGFDLHAAVRLLPGTVRVWHLTSREIQLAGRNPRSRIRPFTKEMRPWRTRVANAFAAVIGTHPTKPPRMRGATSR
jgi:hypothetical protein